jgi:hypothetical protein
MNAPTVPASKSLSLRFGLGAGIGAIALIALTLGLLDHEIKGPYRAEQRAAAELQRLGGYVHLVEDTHSWVAKHLKVGLFDMRVAAIVDLSHSRVTDADLVHLRAFRHFGTVNLSDTRIGDAGIAHLIPVVGERFVDLSRTEVTDTSELFLGHTFRDAPLGIRLSGNHVAGGKIFPAELSVYCPLQELDLSESDADNQTLEAFPIGVVLAKLDLSGTKVTDAGLESLFKLENLRSVDLSRTKVTPEAIADLKARWNQGRPLVVTTGSTKPLIPPYTATRPK